MSGYRHGIYISEEPTGLVSPVKVDSAMPVAFVTAPVHLSLDPYNVTNVPKLCYTYAEAVEYFGFHRKKEIWSKYTAPEVIYSQFALYAVAPIVIVNVLDPRKHKRKEANAKVKLENDSGTLEIDGVLIDTVKIEAVSEADITAEKLIAGEHYSLSYDENGYISINALSGIAGNAELTLSCDVLDPDSVTAHDIIGGYNAQTGEHTGLELLNNIYPLFRLVPGQVIAPRFSSNPGVAAVMETKAGNINGHFRCIALNDIPTVIKEEGEEDKRLLYTDVPAWAKKNNYVYTRQINCYPKVFLDDLKFDYSVQLAGLICLTDSQNSGVPYASPSNRNLKINGLCYEDGMETVLNNEQANYLNGQGIVTAINFAKGWTAWGSRTGIYPGSTDVKDAFIPVRRMFDWIGNTITLSYWNKIDLPMTTRNIYTIVDSVNMWLNGLAAREYILGGKLEFLPKDNIITDLLDGIIKFRLKIAPPPPMRAMEFILEYDPDYLSGLFS